MQPQSNNMNRHGLLFSSIMLIMLTIVSLCSAVQHPPEAKIALPLKPHSILRMLHLNSNRAPDLLAAGVILPYMLM
jgi:hypothetical protein